MSDKSKQIEKPKYCLHCVVIFFVILLVCIYGWYFLEYLDNGHQESVYGFAELGQLGDYFGGLLNPILAFLAFIILVRSYQIQKQELGATTAEMKVANEAQKELLKQQNQANQLQSFENLFFQMLTMKNRFINELTLPGTLTSLVRDNVHPKYETDRAVLEDFKSQLEEINKYVTIFDYIQDKFSTAQKDSSSNVLMFKRQIDSLLMFDHEYMSLNNLRVMIKQGLLPIRAQIGGDYYDYYQLSFTDRWWQDFHKDFEVNKQKIVFISSEITRLNNEVSILDTRRKYFIEQLENSNNLPAFVKMQLTLNIFEEFEPDSWADYMKKGLSESYFGFFNVNYQLLMLIDESQVLEALDLKRKYFEIYQAQLSNDELKLLFWNTKDSKRFDYLKVFNEFNAFENMYWSDPRHKYQYHVLAEDWESYRAEHH